MTRDDYNPEDFDIFQQEAIRQALEKNIDIIPYLNRSYHSACINEIAMGLKHHIDVTPYAKPEYSWRKMKELRLGIEQCLDISNYANPLYSYWQMREIRLGLTKGLDVSCYKSLMYTAKEMKKRRLWLLKHQKSHWAEENMTMICADDYEIRISRDGMQAYFNWHGNRPLMNAVELEYILRKILENIKNTWSKEYAKISMEICRYHHERYDGNGYPEGLKGDEIPIYAQIVSVADVYDALIHERVYKSAIPKDHAFRMIINGECGVFSPVLLTCLTNCREQMEAV